MIESQKAANDVEVYHLYVEKCLTVKLVIFHLSYDYLVLASSNFAPYHGVKVIHKDKGKCARMAIKQMYQLIKG